jgi:hypothetical protein
MGPPPAVGQAPPEPSADELLCIHGPCRYYWELETNFNAGNPEGTFEPGKEPRLTRRWCIRCPQDTTDLKGAAVYSCTEYEPMTTAELQERKRRHDLVQIKKPEEQK